MKTRDGVAYRRLPGRARKRFGLFTRERGVLWLASDHLLHIRATAHSETCKRFGLKDIQALTIVKTSAGTAVSITLGVLALAAGMPAITLAYGGNAGLWAASLGATAGILALLAATSVALGNTCKCCLYTAVQVEELPSLGRLRTARRTAALLRTAVEEAQSRLTPETLDTAPPLVRAAASASPAGSGGSALGAHPTRRHESGNVHAAFFALLAALAVLNVIELLFQHRAKDFLDLAVYAAALIACAIALRRQQNTDVPNGLRTVTWVSLAALITMFCAFSVYGIAFFVSYAVEHPDEAAALQPLDVRPTGPVFTVFCVLTAVLEAALALAGLILLRTFRNAHAARSASTPPELASEPEV